MREVLLLLPPGHSGVGVDVRAVGDCERSSHGLPDRDGFSQGAGFTSAPLGRRCQV